MKLFILILLFASTSSMAGTASGKVTKILSHTDGGNGHGVFLFTIDGQRDNAPACSISDEKKTWALSLEKESGRAIYSLLLSAQAQGKSISVVGRGNCNSWGDSEEPRYVTILN